MTADQNQGEGNVTAAKEYNEKTQKFAKEGDVEGQARKAAEALDGDEGEKLRDAEEKGRIRAREEDPQIHRDR